MREIRTSLFVAAILAMAACGGAATEPVGRTAAHVAAVPGDTVELRVGDVAVVAGTGTRIRFRRVASDSRCPTDVACVWQGDAHVRLDVTTSAGERTIDLHTGVEPRAAVVGGMVVRLLRVLPEPVSDRTIPLHEYVVRLELGHD